MADISLKLAKYAMIQQNYNNAELYAKTALDAEHPVSFLIFAGYEFTIPRVINSIF